MLGYIFGSIIGYNFGNILFYIFESIVTNKKKNNNDNNNSFSYVDIVICNKDKSNEKYVYNYETNELIRIS